MAFHYVDIADWNTNFFLGELGGPIFLRYNVTTTNSLGYQFGSLSAIPWPDKISLFLKIY